MMYTYYCNQLIRREHYIFRMYRKTQISSNPVGFLEEEVWAVRPSWILRRSMTLTTSTSHSIRFSYLYLLSSHGKDEYPHGSFHILPRQICKYMEREVSSSLVVRPTAVHRIVFRRHLSSRSGITLPRWYTMTFISGFLRFSLLAPWSFLLFRVESYMDESFVALRIFLHIQTRKK